MAFLVIERFTLLLLFLIVFLVVERKLEPSSEPHTPKKANYAKTSKLGTLL